MHILTLTLDLPLLPQNITGFRAAIAETVGLEHELFHGHANSSGTNHLHWGYPLIQYSTRGGKATITGINAGAEAIRQQLLPKLPRSLEFVEQSHTIKGYQVREREQPLVLQAETQTFGLRSWIPLNNNNYRAWKAAEDNPDERQRLLNCAFTGQLRQLARSLDVPWYTAIHGEVLAVDEIKRVHWHRVPLVRLYARVTSCFVPPPDIHMGRMVAYGFGRVCQTKYYEKWLQRRNRRVGQDKALGALVETH